MANFSPASCSLGTAGLMPYEYVADEHLEEFFTGVSVIFSSKLIKKVTNPSRTRPYLRLILLIGDEIASAYIFLVQSSHGLLHGRRS